MKRTPYWIAVSFLVACTQVDDAAGPPIIDQDNAELDCQIPSDEPGLLNDGRAEWAGAGEEVLSADGTSALATVVLQGPSHRVAELVVEARARIGNRHVELLNARRRLEPAEVARVAIDLRPALALDSAQLDHVTHVVVSVAALDETGRVLERTSLPGRYLAVQKEGTARVFCNETFVQRYADGLTNADARQRYHTARAALPPDDSISLGVGPGLYKFTPSAE
ncbi:MAG: hypothetical protein RMA76_20055 [Deltaproteobacteria bacterium]|jgi:hypothetical protein